MRTDCRFLLIFFLLTAGCATGQGEVLYSPAGPLPFTTPAMKTAGYWISRHPYPDKVILSESEIRQFNLKIQNEQGLTRDLTAWPAVITGKDIETRLSQRLEKLKSSHLVKLSGETPSQEYWKEAETSFNLAGIGEEVPRQYALVVRYTDEKFLPTEEGLYAKKMDVDFDELQNNALDIGTAVVVLHTSKDKAWGYVQSSGSDGWVKISDIALADDNQIKTVLSEPFIITTSPKADIYLDHARTQFLGYVLMGTRLPVVKITDDTAEVLLPQREPGGQAQLVSGFISADQFHEGYLSYTPRNVLLQAFKMFNAPYGWGGMYGEQDCSRFLQEVFATVGIALPRDSKNQIKVGELLAQWDKDVTGAQKLESINNFGIGGITVLGMRGHIVLFLGSVDGRAYAIHAVWAYRRPAGERDDIYVLNRVVVSDLSLGEGSKRGSLLNRMHTMRRMQ